MRSERTRTGGANVAAEYGVMVGFADPAKTTRWWLRCDRKAAIDEVRAVVGWHPSWFAEHGLRAEYGTCEGDVFTPAETLETLDTSSVKLK